ncbi:MAG: glycosyltransferase family 4 protein [Alphaproteobacteria bacterium]|nr:glycosyltransferase family 4 protein [Alphaproteobacteria bacterium]
MNWLFIHQNFPAQYVHAARHLAASGDRVVFVTQQHERQLPGVRKIVYPAPAPSSGVHPCAADLDLAVQNGTAVARICEELKAEGFTPDLVAGHNGWGEILYIKEIWPSVPLLGYFEFFYRTRASDLDFDPEFSPTFEDRLRVRTRNAVNLLGLETANWGQTPTEFQRGLYPEAYRRRISVVHEGIDTETVRPDPTTQLWLAGGLALSGRDPVITYSARNLEPYRGFHVLMRALPDVLDRHPTARVLIAGGNDVSYGRRPARAASWREQLLAELGGRLDLSRVHFLGYMNYQQYLALLQVSSVHVYLTYPFVLSWGLLEAMAAGCVVVASRTAPVEEVIADGVNGLLVEFFDPAALAERIGDVLARPERHAALGTAARQTVVDRYDLARVCLPAYLRLLRRVMRNTA